MGNAELIELKNSSIQCPSYLHHIFEIFEILKARYYQTSMIVTRGGGCGPNPWPQHHHKAPDALRSATKGERTFTSILDRWQHDEIYRKSQLSHIGRTHGPGTWTTWRSSTSATMHRNCRERLVNLLHWRSLDSNKHAGPLWKRPGYQEATKELANLQKLKRQVQVLYNPVSDRKREHNRLDPSLQEYLEWLSIHWAEHFAEPQNSERQQPSSPSSWSPSPTCWSSSSWNQSWQKWHSHGWQDEKWSDKW